MFLRGNYLEKNHLFPIPHSQFPYFVGKHHPYITVHANYLQYYFPYIRRSTQMKLRGNETAGEEKRRNRPNLVRETTLHQ
jgi:hypothetical protein